MTIGGVLCALGSTAWMISATIELIACLRTEGKPERADLLEAKLDRLRRDHERLKAELEKVRGRAS